ncbi:hypothetical protein Tco_0789407 [Tanacetum coccineum]
MTFGGNTRDLDSIRKETGQDCNFTRSGFKNCIQWLDTASEILTTPSELASDGVRIFVTTSERNRLNETLEDLSKCSNDVENNQKVDARNQAVIQDDCVDIQIKNVGYAGNGNRNARQPNRNKATNACNGLVQLIEEYDQNVQRIPRTESIRERKMFNATIAMEKATMHMNV